MRNVLGVSIGTRNVGIAVIKLRKLTDYRIRTFPGKWTQEKSDVITDIIQKVINRNAITHLVIKIPVPSHCSPNIQLLLKDIERKLEYQSITMYRCTIEDLKQYYGNGRPSNKHELIAAFTSKYPELHRRSKKGKRTYVYHSKIFEAIACAELAQGAGH